MDARTTSLEEFLKSVLRGSAKMLGCSSTNLVLINQRTGEIFIRLGAMASSFPVLEQLEEVMGGAFRKISFTTDQAADSLIVRSWRDQAIRETSSLEELVGSAIPAPAVEQISALIGEHCYMCVPALSGGRNYGVVLFEKEGARPFSRQQCEVALRCARRIGETLENDLVSHGSALMSAADAAMGGDQKGNGDADQALENQLLHLTLGAPAPALFLDPERVVTSCNAAAEELFGVPSAELAGRPVARLFHRPEEIELILARQLLDPGAPASEERATALEHGGGLQPARVEAVLLADAEHRGVGFMVLVRTEPWDTREATGRLVRQERLATMGELAAQLAHELRNPLVAIGATLDSLGHDADLGDEHREILAALAREVDQLDMTLRDHLVAARNELRFTDVPLAEVVAEAGRVRLGRRWASGEVLTMAVAPDLRVWGDRDALKHLFFNLLNNALEASGSEPRLRCGARLRGQHVVAVVEDRGQGLQAGADACLQPFFTTKANGSGLGLAVCQKIARAHGGLVELSDREGGGCRVEVTLPLDGGGVDDA